MNGEYPITIEGRQVGLLTVENAGLLTVFSAECEDLGRVVRLSVFGPDGTEGKLGVMLPEDGGMRLCRSFSRSAMRDFPSEIAAVGETGGEPGVRETASVCGETEEDETAAEPAAAEATEAAKASEMPTQGGGDTLWFPVPEGTLVSLEPPSMLAMPWRDGVTRGEERVIEGKRYAVIRPDEIAIPAEE